MVVCAITMSLAMQLPFQVGESRHYPAAVAFSKRVVGWRLAVSEEPQGAEPVGDAVGAEFQGADVADPLPPDHELRFDLLSVYPQVRYGRP